MSDAQHLGRFLAALPQSTLERRAVEIAPESLHTFVQLAWEQVIPSEPFVDGKVIHRLCEYLEAVTRLEIRNLVINVPPGFSKSLVTGVFWPAWEWITNPGQTAVYTSYDGTLTMRDAKRTHELVTSKWYRERWGTVVDGSRQPYGDFYTVARGNRFSTSIKGKVTGRHFLRHVCDDPIKPRDTLGGAAVTEAELTGVIEYWDQTLSSRTNDPLRLTRVVVMQRLHERDLSGHVLDKGGYEHLCIPMQYEERAKCSGCKREHACGDWRTREGELAHPERFPEDAVTQLKRDLGSQSAVAAQLQQRPTPRGGLIFTESTFRYWHPNGRAQLDQRGNPCLPAPLDRAGTWFQSWDLNFKEGDTNDNVARGVWQGIDNLLYLHHAAEEQIGFVATCHAMIGYTREWPRALRKLVENKANGPAIEDTLKKVVPGIVLWEPQGSKPSRAHACQTVFGRHEVIFPHPDIAPWVVDLEACLLKFPYGAHDDLVDMTTQAILDYFLGRNELEQAMNNLVW